MSGLKLAQRDVVVYVYADLCSLVFATTQFSILIGQHAIDWL